MKKKIKDTIIGIITFGSLLTFLWFLSSIRFNSLKDILYGLIAILRFIVFYIVIEKYGKEDKKYHRNIFK